MRIMCTIVATVLGSALLLVSVVFIGASSQLGDGDFVEHLQKREVNDRDDGLWELVSSATGEPRGPVDRMMRFDELKRERGITNDDDPLEAENSHVVVQVYSVDSDQEFANESAGTPIRSMKVENFATPKEQMDGKATDRIERKVFAPVRNIQEKLAKMESAEKSGQEVLLQERFFVDDSVTRDANPKRQQFSARFEGQAASAEDFDHEQENSAPKWPHTTAVVPPFFDYNEQTSQRMLDEFFALRNKDAMAARRSNYDWGEAQLGSRTLDEIKTHSRSQAASKKKASQDFSAPSGREDDLSYDRYADYAVEADQRPVSYGGQKLGRKQRATSLAGSQTHVLNKVPIVAYDGDGSMAPMYKADGTHRSQFERSRFHYALPSMVFNPYAWDPYHMNMLRFPQCSACQQNARALCSTCGLCKDCCAHSKCTCGCLNG